MKSPLSTLICLCIEYMSFANTPPPPYYCVTFTSQRANDNGDEYNRLSERMEELAARMPGFLGAESSRDLAGFGITLSYWTDRQSIMAWKQNAEHLEAQRLGKQKFYKQYSTRITKVERHYSLN